RTGLLSSGQPAAIYHLLHAPGATINVIPLKRSAPFFLHTHLHIDKRTFRATEADRHDACIGMFTQKIMQCIVHRFIEKQWHLSAVDLRVRRISDRTWGHEVKEADVCLFESRKAIDE